MDHATHVARLAEEADRYRVALAAADPSATVAACPGWTVTDLTEHLGTVHRWSRLAVATPSDAPAPSYDGSPEADGMTLREWYDAGAVALVQALTDAGPDDPCWTMADPRTARFWARRQAHELAVHRWDLEHAAGRPGPIDPDLAGDGVAEILDTMLPRQVRLGRIAATTDWLRLVVDGEELELATMPGDHEAGPVGTVQGSAEDVVLLLWGRLRAEDLQVTGDASEITAVVGRAHVP